ncbi:sirohydrochlorin chelatase [Agarivorans sp. QJM3NY_29]|uniref:sirohydrochlorin chelatase n=1 Tax=unclassified Agarivorans TaxID=2636026 RepID=UPI003D7D6B6C
MKALLVVAHGSRRQQSNQEVIDLAAQMAGQLPSYQQTHAAFLELVEPSISQQINMCVAAGIVNITLYPHFLAAGTHVVNDLPRIIQQAEASHAGLNITLLPHLGGFDGLAAFVCQSLEQSVAN